MSRRSSAVLSVNERLWIMNNIRLLQSLIFYKLNKVQPEEPCRVVKSCSELRGGHISLLNSSVNWETSSCSRKFENLSRGVISLSKKKNGRWKDSWGALLKHRGVPYGRERGRDPHLWWVMKVILSKWWNYIQQSPRGSISHCSLTGKINWDLLIHRERPPPPSSVSLSKKRSEGNLLPRQHRPTSHPHHSPPPPPTPPQTQMSHAFKFAIKM